MKYNVSSRGNGWTLHAVRNYETDCWFIHDSFGQYDGPYKTAFDCNREIAKRQQYELDHLTPEVRAQRYPHAAPR